MVDRPTRKTVGAIRALEPVRDPRASVTDLLDVLLDKGVVLNLDLLISVADIPLLGVSVKAALAGVETMLEYGMMRRWDEQTRAWVQRSLTRHVPLATGETLVMRMAGSCFDAAALLWRPGTVYLTDRRLLVFRREPPAVLLSQSLSELGSVRLARKPTFAGEFRVEVRLALHDGTEALVTAEDPERLAHRIRALRAGRDADTVPATTSGRLIESELWYHEPRASGSTWRAGRAVLEYDNGLTWRGVRDSRPSVRVRRSDLRAVRTQARPTPGATRALTLDTAGGEVVFAGEQRDKWIEALQTWRADETNIP